MRSSSNIWFERKIYVWKFKKKEHPLERTLVQQSNDGCSSEQSKNLKIKSPQWHKQRFKNPIIPHSKIKKLSKYQNVALVVHRSKFNYRTKSRPMLPLFLAHCLPVGVKERENRRPRPRVEGRYIELWLQGVLNINIPISLALYHKWLKNRFERLSLRKTVIWKFKFFVRFFLFFIFFH